MSTIKYTIKWDFVLLVRYGIVAVAAAVSSIYCISLLLTEAEGLENLVVVLVFSDPVMYGFLFTAVMVLFEKDAMTNQALAVTPLTAGNYLISKGIVFTCLAFVCSLAIVMSAGPNTFHPVIFLAAILFSSLLFVFLGVVGVSFTNNFTQFILIIPLVFLPACLPFLSYFELYSSWIFYIIPTQACLILFKASISYVEVWEIIYSISYLIVWNYFAFRWAIKSYNKRILKSDRDE
jgi:fluoroquinolone transport system permease protein